MGGRGSGWQGTKKDVVDDCIVLSIKELIRERVLLPGNYRRGSLTCRSVGRAVDFDYESELRQDGTGSLFIRYTGAGQQFCHWVSLRSTVPNFGGRRWWFVCPLKDIRVSQLYLLPGTASFASRQAYHLTYTSCQESGRVDRLCSHLARRLGRDEAELRSMFKRAARASNAKSCYCRQ